MTEAEQTADAPRVTPNAIERAIRAEHYFTAADGVFGSHAGSHGRIPEPREYGRLPLLTFCVLELDNGFLVTGESSCVSAANFDAGLGRKYAREDAIRKAWALLGFRLADTLARSSP